MVSVIRSRTTGSSWVWLPLSSIALLCCQGTIGDGDGPAAAGPTAEGSFELQAPVLPRLTEQQYRNTLTDLFGPDLPPTPLQPDTNPYLFYSIGAASTETVARKDARPIMIERSISKLLRGVWGIGRLLILGPI